MKLYYCPYCGKTQNIKHYSWEEPNQHLCPNCNSVGEFIECNYDEKYYSDKAHKLYYEGEDSPEKMQMRRQYGLFGLAQKILLEEEISKNPLFDLDKYAKSKELEKQQSDHILEKISNNSKNIPKCPTCNSTDISKISALKKVTHAYAFGLFSKTAKSQFVCNNCGYKW